MQVSLQYAREHFDDLASALDRGEEVEIERPEKPALRLTVVDEPGSVAAIAEDRKRILGAGRGKFPVPGVEEWAEMDRELAVLMLDGPVFPAKKP